MVALTDGGLTNSSSSRFSSRISKTAINAVLIAIITLVCFSFLFHDPENGRGLAPDGFGDNEDIEPINSHNARLLAQSKSHQLEEKYLSNLKVANTRAQIASPKKGLRNFGEKTKHNATIVIGRLDEEPERVQWVYDELLNIQDIQIYIVNNPNTTFPHLKKNHGREAAVYLNYIIDNYDNLNDITFFWHTDKKVWHNNLLLGWDSVQTINRMDRDNIMRQGYVPSRCDHWPGCPYWVKFNPSTAEHNIDPHRLEEMFNPELFKYIFPNATSFPPYFAGTCCSQFAVSRDTIRRNSIELYKRLLKWVVDYESDDHSGMVFEYTWPYIFLGRGSLCPSMQECYCKTYNFCLQDFKDIEQLENWNALRTRREEIKWQVNFVEQSIDAKKAAFEAQGASPKDIATATQVFTPEFDRLTHELEHLTNVTWLSREEIIHKWGLGIPPVGW